MTPEEHARRRAIYSALSDFFRCPITGRIIQGSDHDDKVLCGCGRTNPAILRISPKADETGGIPGGAAHHVKKFLERSTVDDFLVQMDIDQKVKGGEVG